MKMVPAQLLCPTLAAAATLLVACSGTRTTGPVETPVTDPGSGEVATPVTQDPQDPNRPSVQQQRLSAQIAQRLANARTAMEQSHWHDAAIESAYVLELDNDHAEARSINQAAREQLGDAGAKNFDDSIVLARVDLERDRFRAQRELTKGDALVADGRFGDAIEAYEKAGLILQSNIFANPESTIAREISNKLADAKQQEQIALQDANAADRARTQRARQDAERQAGLARQSRVIRLLEQSNKDFQFGNYENSVTLLDQALALDPTNGAALALRDLAGRARHENRLDVVRVRWATEWTRTFDDLNQSYALQTEPIKYDLARWAEVQQRKPLDSDTVGAQELPEERAILSKLRDTVINHRFATATVQDWAKFYQDQTDVNFIIASDVSDLDEETTTLSDFNLNNRSVQDALDIIGLQTGLKWHVRDGIVELVSADNSTGRTYLRQYEVRDITSPVPNNPGPELTLNVGDGGDDGFDEDEPPPAVVDDGTLQDIIRDTIEADSWDEVGTMTYNNGVLVINHTKEVHAQVNSLLEDMRRAVGVQVDVEARFLTVEDNFLEDIGVDFRGLGDQAADGIPGRGLENRPAVRFDDFGQPELINPASPGTTGTGTEPGIFFDDGADGDLLGRTENLFDSTLGNGVVDNSGGLSLQYAYLDDIELEVILRAVDKQDRSEEIVAPRLLVANNTRAHITALRHTTYIRDFDVEIAQNAAVANPVVDVIRDGVVLDVRPVVSADRRFITMEMRPTLLNVTLPIPTFSTTLGAGQPVSIQLPEVTLQRVRTTVTLPDGGTLLLGGMKLAERQDLQSGIPVLKDLPGLSLLFGRKGNFVLNRRILILIKGTIILNSEYEPVLLGEEIGPR